VFVRGSPVLPVSTVVGGSGEPAAALFSYLVL